MNWNRIIRQRGGVIVVSLMTACVGLGAASRAAAQDLGDIAAGRQLVERWCGNCHVAGPDESRGSSTGAPTFTAIAQMKTTTPLGLQAFLQTPHARMPDLHLTRNEIDDIVGYVLSLRRK